jgi:hypothetical protein
MTKRLAKIVGVATAVAAVLAFTAHGVSSGQGGVKVFVISGKGNSTSTSTSSSGSTGGCDKAVLVIASASISGGDTGNEVTAEARCAAIAVATATAVVGTLDFDYEVLEPSTIPVGTPTCVRILTPTPSNSAWTVRCVFLY